MLEVSYTTTLPGGTKVWTHIRVPDGVGIPERDIRLAEQNGHVLGIWSTRDRPKADWRWS